MSMIRQWAICWIDKVSISLSVHGILHTVTISMLNGSLGAYNNIGEWQHILFAQTHSPT